MAAASAMQQIIFALIQAPQAAQGLDLLGLIDYWTSMIDIDIDMKKFRLAPPAAAGGAVGPDGQPIPGDPAAQLHRYRSCDGARESDQSDLLMIDPDLLETQSSGSASDRNSLPSQGFYATAAATRRTHHTW